MVDRRHGAGGHWLDAYPFVRLHQASAFYGVASTLLGGGRIQQDGPEAGLHERATAPEICAYYARVLQRADGRVRPGVLPPELRLPRRRPVRVPAVGRAVRGPSGAAVVDARYLSPTIPRETPPPFGVADGVHVVAVNDLVTIDGGALAVRDRRVRARPRPTRASGCSTTGSIRTRSAGCGHATPGCSTARSCSPTRRSSSGWRPTSWRPRPRRCRRTTCSSGWRTPA